jgi:hypothetical protein
MDSTQGTRALPQVGFPIRIPPDQSSISSSPGHFAAVHVLHRPLVPRHPPCALVLLSSKFAEVFREHHYRYAVFKVRRAHAHHLPRAHARVRAPEPALLCGDRDPLGPWWARAADGRRRGRTRERKRSSPVSQNSTAWAPCSLRSAGHASPCSASGEAGGAGLAST